MQVKLDLESSRVKGVAFHPNRPWVLYCTHTGTVHLHDYEIGVELACYKVTNDNIPVRCVAFHPTQPLFACGTDNYEVIVYNWARKMKLFTLTGHLDYVRSVEFHAVYPLLISSSDDSTARIWNWQSRCCIAILEEHTYFVMCARFNPQKPLIATASLDDCVRVFNVNTLFNSSMSKDVESSFFSMEDTSVLTSELEEHPEGADCVAWDQSGNKLYSCGEDSRIKIYNIVNDEATLSNQIFTHNGAVTGIAVHYPTSNFVSVSEDSTLRVFDGSTNQQIAKFEVPVSRFWCVACHPKDALIAAGHDRGLVILKFAKERPPFDVQGNSVLWVQDGEFRVVDVVSKASEKPISARHRLKSLSWNSSRNLALASYIDNSKGEEVHEIVDMHMKNPIVQGEGGSAIWLSRSSMASLSVAKDKLLVKEIGSGGTQTSTVRPITIPHCSKVFAGSQQRVYLASRSSIVLFDVIRTQIISEIPFSNAKCVVFDDKRENICCRNSNSLLVAKADLSSYFIYHDSNKIKSCCFCGGAVLYTTRCHLKYIVKSTSGVVCSLPRVLYIIKAAENTAWFITRDGIVFKREIEMSEVKLKAALIQSHSEDTAKRIIRENPPIGQAIMEFAASHNRFDIASSLARDPKTKFELSLKSGDYKAAAAAADELNDPKYHKTLAQSLMNAGLFGMAESSLKKAKDFESLAFLYLISGESEKLSKLSKQTNNLEHLLWANDDNTLKRTLQAVIPNIEIPEEDELIMKINPGRPCLADWPMTMTTSSVYASHEQEINLDDEDVAGWSDDDDLDILGGDGDTKGSGNEDDEEGWNIDIDINESDMIDLPTSSSAYSAPTRGESIQEKWASNSQTAGDFCAAGNFSEALAVLQKTIGLKNAAPLRDLFVETFISANSCVPSMFYDLTIAPISTQFRNQLYPSLPSQLGLIDEMTKSALSAFSRGKFSDCYQTCCDILHRIAICVVSNHEEEQKLLDSLETARNYCLGVSIEMKRKAETDTARQIELATYLTYLKLIPSHIRLVLQSAMRVLAKGENYLTCKPICQRILDMAPPEKIAKQAQQMLALCTQKASNKYKIDFDERNPFVVCAMSMKPIYRGRPVLQCPFCGASYAATYKGQVCSICEMCEIGAQCSGLKLLRYGK
ncbi:Coatomer subunit alpha-3 [Tritrichomonas foetus]|uniref:Coatomer subunit alpha-3 n=1 Tax=Tritrichomonas foetus TaxID=1144522 RepID=A0A1J4K2J0_9EUKA|nr:Coatomer subunit alpha-3 [Tritrichomonas foetus]|eukprot:OHT05607.1 Coatomer subunit alpha-3 [Tritrichomonas foetus]